MDILIITNKKKGGQVDVGMPYSRWSNDCRSAVQYRLQVGYCIMGGIKF